MTLMSEEEVIEMIENDHKYFYREITGAKLTQKPKMGSLFERAFSRVLNIHSWCAELCLRIGRKACDKWKTMTSNRLLGKFYR